MFLALKEMKREKLRYGLIISMVVLIGYLIFILTSLAIGLARQNTLTIDSWDAKTVIMNKDSNISLDQSMITKDQVGKLNRNQALIGQTPVVTKATNRKNESARFLGTKSNQFIYQQLKLIDGHRPQNTNQVVVDDQFKTDGYKLGDKIVMNSNSEKYEIVGFMHDQKYSIAPVIYGSISTWQKLKGVNPNIIGSGLIIKGNNPKFDQKYLKSYSMNTFINKLPGYSAQNTTFGFMIGFLMVISLVVIAVFLYILTMQKLANYAVLRAQGIPSKVLVRATIAQSLIIVISGLVISGVLTLLTAQSIPIGVPMYFDVPILSGVTIAMILISIIAALIPIRTIVKVDPVTVIGG
ncbi:ABC transporter permease [Lentilactobacillus kosonis]|uniref:Putative hemin transport system permease protein HrtB n=1 Tax=Lentilactobacillus kosonis TaxID=2810561 RepID=A0A401FLY6_9LACO|nr:FtsX-like permease family protein [Lentilactobacillus kosonis]GAY73399.1 ABC transporter permease component [Lentilactobacillus kosonis]